jgi:hypothetical protein
MKGTLQFFSIMIFALLLGIVVGNAGGHAIMYLDEFEVDRTIK